MRRPLQSPVVNTPTLSSAFRDALRSLLPADAIIDDTDPRRLKLYGRDWTKKFAPAPTLVLFPSTTAEVSSVCALCSTHNISIVPSGGRTGLAGGAVAAQGEVVLSLERMHMLHEVDTVARTLRVQAGAVTAAVHAHALEADLMWPVDFASTGSSHIGGNLSTNAGGVRVVRYGLTRNWVLGVQVVLMNGDVLELGGALEKNNTGIDLRQLFIGSEGILGIITEATLKLTTPLSHTRVALLGVGSLAQSLEVFRATRDAEGVTLLACEYVAANCLQAVLQEQGRPAPFERPAPAYILLELQGGATVDTWLEGVFEAGLVCDGVLAQSATEAAALWSLRENIGESLSRCGLLHKNDVALPISNLPAFAEELDAALLSKYPDFATYIFGHVGDGNLHINIMKPAALNAEEFYRHCAAADRDMFTLVKKYGGSISAEHGIGLLKKNFLGYSRSPVEIDLMRQLKTVFDPKGLLNPGKVI